jgi:hypothetical protein
VQRARRKWRAQRRRWDPAKLVFLDETWASTNMARRYGRSPRGQRFVAAVPHGHWKTTTFIAGLRHDSITAPLVLDGPMDGAAFLAYVQTFPCPTLRPGDIVIAAAGATIVYLPPYSPDLNPIEKLFAKLKALLRKAAKRSIEALWNHIGVLLDAFPAQECSNYFAATEYVNR